MEAGRRGGEEGLEEEEDEVVRRVMKGEKWRRIEEDERLESVAMEV